MDRGDRDREPSDPDSLQGKQRDKTEDDDERNHSGRRWDDSDRVRTEERGHVEKSHGRSGRSYELTGKHTSREDNRVGGGRSRRSHDEDRRQADAPRDDKQKKGRDRSPGTMEEEYNSAYKYSSGKGEKDERHRYHREAENHERFVNTEEDSHGRGRERSGREVIRERSRSPERRERHYRDIDEHNIGYSESDNERLKVKEREEGYNRDDRSFKARESSWNDKNSERNSDTDHWNRSQVRQESKEGESRYESRKDWDLQRRENPVYRRDGRGRTDSRSSSYRNANETDSIEIKPNTSFDFGREGSASTFQGRRNEGTSQQEPDGGVADDEWGYRPEESNRISGTYADDAQESYHDGGSPRGDQSYARNSFDSQSGKGRGPKSTVSSSQNDSSPVGSNQGSGSFYRASQQGQKGNRNPRGRGRPPARDAQRLGLQLPMMGPPFGHLGMPPGPMQPMGPNISHTPGPPIGPGVFMPAFPSPIVWPGPRGVDMNMLAAVPPNLPPIPPGPAGPRFPPNIGSCLSQNMFFNQPGPGRGALPNSSPGLNPGPAGRGMPNDKTSAGWTPSRNSGTSSKPGPSRGEQNDYSQNFVDTGARPQNFIRELELTSVVEDYPKLRELIQRKDEIVANSASPPMYFKCDLKEHILSPEVFATKFDVILVDPPWEEYVHRAPGVTDNIEYWSFEEIQNLKIEAIADTPSFIFLWVGDGVGLEQGRQCLKKWGFRRCEDICWVKTNKKTPTTGLRHDSNTLFQHSKEHCLMGIKGTVRRSTDGHIIHANIDTDIIIAEEPSDPGSTKKPEDMYRIIEHFALGRRRLELFGEDHNIRQGWLTVGKGLSSSNFNREAYIKNFADKDSKVWQGGGGRNPPPDAPHLVVTTPEIESLRPKSPPPKNQQQQPATLLPGTAATTGSNSRRPAGNSPQNSSVIQLSGMNQDIIIPGSDPSATPMPWGSPMGGFRGPTEGGHHPGPDDKFFEGHSFSGPPFMQVMGDHIEFDPHRSGSML